MSKLNTDESIAIEWLQENIESALDDDPDVGIFANPELANIFRQCISFIEDQETIQSLQEENEKMKLIAETEANTAIAILNSTDDKTVKDLAAHIADQLISITDVKDL